MKVLYPRKDKCSVILHIFILHMLKPLYKLIIQCKCILTKKNKYANKSVTYIIFNKQFNFYFTYYFLQIFFVIIQIVLLLCLALYRCLWKWGHCLEELIIKTPVNYIVRIVHYLPVSDTDNIIQCYILHIYITLGSSLYVIIWHENKTQVNGGKFKKLF